MYSQCFPDVTPMYPTPILTLLQFTSNTSLMHPYAPFNAHKKLTARTISRDDPKKQATRGYVQKIVDVAKKENFRYS